MLSIRAATVKDASLLASMILELAEYEHLAHEAGVTAEAIARDGFGPNPKFRAILAELDGQPAGYAVFFEFYSTFQGRAGLFLDDIYVRPQLRKQGIGYALLAHVSRIAWDENYFCVRWEVLDWNKPAIDFYHRLGAVFMDEWRNVMLIGDALQSAASSAK